MGTTATPSSVNGIFRLFDINKDGVVDRDEMRIAMANLGLELREEELNTMMAEFSDGCGEIGALAVRIVLTQVLF